MSWIGAIILQARAEADACDGFSLPFGRCVEFDGLLGNWVSGLIAAAVLAVGGAVAKPLWRRWRRSAAGTPALTDEIRSRLLEVARSRSWGQLRDLIGLPDGFTELRLEPRVGLVAGARTEAASARPAKTAEPGIVEAFEGNHRRLLLVGGPGSGKTVLAYKIATYLDRRHQADPAEPLPVVLNLTTWTSESTSLADWIIDQLCDSVIGLGLNDRTLAAQLVTTNRLALILDGLDEVPEASRPSCLAAINTHITSRPPPPAAPLVVTCRRVEYEALMATASPLGLLAAREPLSLDSYTVTRNLAVLAGVDPRWMVFTRRSLARSAAQVVEALQSPLLLSLSAETGFDPEPLLHCSDAETVGQLICRAKVDSVLARPDMPLNTDTWLTAIATTNRQIFRLEDLTPSVASRRLIILVGLGTGMAFGLTIGVAIGLVGGLVSGLVFGLVSVLCVGLLGLVGTVDPRPTQHNYRVPNRRELKGGLGVGLVGGLFVGLVSGLVGGLALGLFGGPGVGLVDGLHGGLIIAPVFGLVFGLATSFRVDQALLGSVEPDQGMLLSRRSYIASITQWVLTLGVSFGLLGGLLGELFLGLVGGLVGGLVAGLVAGLNAGGAYMVLQRVRRRQLRRAGIMPADPVASLQWAVEQRLMRQIGGGFQFRHNLLRDATAARDPHHEIPQLTLYG